MATPAAAQLELVLKDHFPGIRFGRYNCRKIAGSNKYSQHSWNNARDLYAPTDDPHPTAFLDEVVEFIEIYQDELNVRVVLWQIRDHYTHAHADMWPTGINVPPCDGGEEEYENYDGTIIHGSPPLNEIWKEPNVLEETSNPAFQPAWDKAIEVGMFTEWTLPSDVVTAEKLAVFLNRVGLLEEQQ